MEQEKDLSQQIGNEAEIRDYLENHIKDPLKLLTK